MLLAAVLVGGCAARRTPEEDAAMLAIASRTFVPSEQSASATPSSAAVLAAFEDGDDDGAYRLGPGDLLAVDVWGRDGLGSKQTIGPDGRISLPVVGGMKIADQTADEAGKSATEAMARYFKDVVATVRVEDYRSNRVVVLGRVAKPGVLQFESRPTLLDAIARAGAFPVGGVGADKTALNQVAIFRGRDRVVWVDLKSLLNTSSLALNLRLKRDDVIYIPDSNTQLVYVLGEVHTPGAYRLTPDMSFLAALATAGGPNEDGDQEKVHLVRPHDGAATEIDFKDLVDGRADVNYSLKEGDVLYVPRRAARKFGYFMQQISPLTTLILGAGLAVK